MDSLLGIALLNTFIGLENVSKNTQQYEKQRLTNAKIDRIYTFLKEREGYQMDLHKYISKADAEITALIEKESMTMTSVGQQNLHNILENRKDIMKWAEDMSAVHSGHIGTPMNNTTSYFGG